MKMDVYSAVGRILHVDEWLHEIFLSPLGEVCTQRNDVVVSIANYFCPLDASRFQDLEDHYWENACYQKRRLVEPRTPRHKEDLRGNAAGLQR